MSKIGEGEIDNQWFKWVKMTIVPRPSHGVCMRVPLPPLGGNGKWKMENGKLFLALALGTIDREAEQRAALLGEMDGWEGCLVGLPTLTKTPLANEREA